MLLDVWCFVGGIRVQWSVLNWGLEKMLTTVVGSNWYVLGLFYVDDGLGRADYWMRIGWLAGRRLGYTIYWYTILISTQQDM